MHLYEYAYKWIVPLTFVHDYDQISVRGMHLYEYAYKFFLPGMGKLDQAEEYLSQARWTVMKTPDCPNNIKHKLCRNLGLLHAAKGEDDHALRELADDVR